MAAPPAGLFDGQAREQLGVRRGYRGGHCIDDGVDFFLGALCQGCASRARHSARASAMEARGRCRFVAAVKKERRANEVRQKPQAFGSTRSTSLAGDDVHGDRLADAVLQRLGVGRGLDRADIATDEHRDAVQRRLFWKPISVLTQRPNRPWRRRAARPMNPFVSTMPSASR